MNLRTFIRPRGKHRPRRTAAPDMAPLAAAIAAGDVEPGEMAHCPVEGRTTYHAIHADGSRTCWPCRTTTEAGA